MGTSEAVSNFDDAMRALGVAEQGEPWRDGWDVSLASFPSGGPEFLKAPFVRRASEELGLSPDVREAIVASLAAFNAEPALQALAWHCHCRLFGPGPRGPELCSREAPDWPADPSELPEWAEMFYPAVLLSGGPAMRELHRSRGIGAGVTRDTAADMELWMRHYRATHGRWGLAQARWLTSHFLGRLYKLGRLQFRFEQFPYGFRAFRSRADGHVVLLAPGGERFRRDGQFDGATGVFDDQGAWTSVPDGDGPTIRGNPVSPNGRALPEPVELSADQWEPILRRGEPVLGVHIPATGPMTHEGCGESFRRAVEFFARHWGEFTFRAFNCTSWFLDNQFAALLPETSNIRRFQEEVYLYPLPTAGDGQTFERVFGARPADMASAPQDTLLRRVIVEHVRRGGHFHAGGMVLFPENLDWGRKVYRREE